MPHGYHVDNSTWFYLSLLLVIAVFCRFHRVFSLRNLDLGLLLASGPGLLLVRDERPSVRLFGFVWLFCLTGVYLIRLLGDGLLKRRPPLSQNLNAPGLGFLCASAFVLLTLQAVSQPTEISPVQLQTSDRDRVIAAAVSERVSSPTAEQSAGGAGETRSTAIEPGTPGEEGAASVKAGPTTAAIFTWVQVMFEELAPRVMAMLAHLAVVVGLLFVGRNLFGDINLGLAMATLYLLLPCTAYDVGEFHYVLPAALIVWAIVAYQDPVVAGVLIGLACGALFFPLFLVPLWVCFYGRRGGPKFLTALTIVAAGLFLSFALISAEPDSFWRKTMGTIRLTELAFENGGEVDGFWKQEGDYASPYRLPVIVGYFVLITVLTIWPRKKNLEHLIAASTAIIVGTQFWYPQQGGVYLLWYLPLLIMVVFRPRLEHLSPPHREPLLVEIKRDPVRPSRTVQGRVDKFHLFR